MTRKIIVLSFLCYAITLKVNSQQDKLYSQYMYMQQMFNPGYVGTNSDMLITGLHREQWTGVEGAPQTSVISISSPLKKVLGIGGSIMRDAVGVSEETSIAVDFSYKFKLNLNYTVSLGLKGELNFFNSDRSQLNILHQNEQIGRMSSSTFSPNFGFGVFLYSQNLYVGYAPSRLIKANADVLRSTWLPEQNTHHNFTAGYVFQSNLLKIKPAALIRYVKGAPVNWHLSGNVSFKDKYEGGLSYQWKSGVSLLTALHITENILAGYTFEIPLNTINEFNSKTHELLLRVRIGKTKTDSELQSSRFF